MYPPYFICLMMNHYSNGAYLFIRTNLSNVYEESKYASYNTVSEPFSPLSASITLTTSKIIVQDSFLPVPYFCTPTSRQASSHMAIKGACQIKNYSCTPMTYEMRPSTYFISRSQFNNNIFFPVLQGTLKFFVRSMQRFRYSCPFSF